MGNNNYKPQVGERVLISPPNCDNEKGYVYYEYDVLWMNDVFILYGNENFYPNLNKLRHVLIKELPLPTKPNTPVSDYENGNTDSDFMG